MNRRFKKLTGLQRLESREMKTAEMGFDLPASVDMLDHPAAIEDASCRGAIVIALSQDEVGGKSPGILARLDHVAPETHGVVVRIENPDGSVDWYYGFTAGQSSGSTSALSPSNVDSNFARLNRGDRLLSFLDSMEEGECGL